MNDKIFELQKELILLQDSFKDAILNEPDVEKHNDIIDSFTKKEQQLFDKIQKEFEKVGVVEIDKDTIEEQEDAENTNDNHPLVNIFKKLVKEGVSAADISKQFKEEELIEIGKEYGFEWNSKGTKTEKVKLLIEAINK